MSESAVLALAVAGPIGPPPPAPDVPIPVPPPHQPPMPPPETSDAIKVIDVRGIDVQPCGGTHVVNTGEIARVVCEKIEKKGRQNRRIVLRFSS